MPEPIRTAVVLDPQPLWADAVASALRGVDFEVVGRATTGADALAQIERSVPDLFVAEIFLESGMDGFDVLREARSLDPQLKLIVLSESQDPANIGKAFECSAQAYVFKTAEPDVLASTIRQLFKRSVYHALPSDSVQLPQASDAALGVLTRREREILRLVSSGRPNGQIAKDIWVTEQTVKFHLSNIYKKLRISNRTEAAQWAHDHGLAPDLREAVSSREMTRQSP